MPALALTLWPCCHPYSYPYPSISELVPYPYTSITHDLLIAVR